MIVFSLSLDKRQRLGIPWAYADPHLAAYMFAAAAAAAYAPHLQPDYWTSLSVPPPPPPSSSLLAPSLPSSPLLIPFTPQYSATGSSYTSTTNVSAVVTAAAGLLKNTSIPHLLNPLINTDCHQITRTQPNSSLSELSPEPNSVSSPNCSSPSPLAFSPEIMGCSVSKTPSFGSLLYNNGSTTQTQNLENNTFSSNLNSSLSTTELISSTSSNNIEFENGNKPASPPSLPSSNCNSRSSNDETFVKKASTSASQSNLVCPTFLDVCNKSASSLADQSSNTECIDLRISQSSSEQQSPSVFSPSHSPSKQLLMQSTRQLLKSAQLLQSAVVLRKPLFQPYLSRFE